MRLLGPGLLISVCLVAIPSCSFQRPVCTNGWYISGYFTPREADYSRSETSRINIEDHGPQVLSTDFIKAVKIEGWGKTRQGWYLGYFSKKWHRHTAPLNSKGKPLSIGSIAIDPRYINQGETINIPSLPSPLNKQRFVANDRGSAIKGKHIDVYTGEGKAAEKRSWKITGRKQTVCRRGNH